MALFKKSESTSAYLKAGFMGFAGAGKTYTATEIAIGLAKLINERKLAQAGKPIFFMDSETGSDYVVHRVREAGLEMYAAKTRSFLDCIEAIKECETSGSVLIIDSITHVWREFCDAYKKKKNRTRMEMLDWVAVKEDWARFTDAYVNSSAHIIMCGRAGYEYEHEEDELTHKKQLIKSGIKMRAEGETGYEPSLLVLMERETDTRTNVVTRTAYVLKERFAIIDGKALPNPKFEDFLPHIQRLNLGGQQLGVDTTRDSTALFSSGDGDSQWKYEQRQKEIALDEIKEEVTKHLGFGMDAGTKGLKAELLEKVSGTRSWARIEAMKWPQVKEIRDRLWLETRGAKYGEEQAPASPVPPSLAADAAPATDAKPAELQGDEAIPHGTNGAAETPVQPIEKADATPDAAATAPSAA
jgi:hypothetical protein